MDAPRVPGPTARACEVEREALDALTLVPTVCHLNCEASKPASGFPDLLQRSRQFAGTTGSLTYDGWSPPTKTDWAATRISPVVSPSGVLRFRSHRGKQLEVSWTRIR